MIEMRDGIKLHTTIYSPKDTSKTYPMLMMRTPYSCRPYGENEFKSKIGPNKYLMEEGNIMIYQDVRGRWNSEGVYDNMRAYIPNKTGNQVDEASDTFDTIEWLVNNVENNNGNIGTYGISYPGFYATYSLLDSHPALKAVSPQACIGDFFFDDFHHNGAFIMGYFKTFPVFGVQKTKPENKAWYSDQSIKSISRDGSIFYREIGTLKEAVDSYYKDNFFMQEIVTHPNYDEFWKSRNLLPHLKGIDHAVMTVGGWYDAEDLTGPLNIYKTIEKNNPKAKNTIVMGPFSHGGWSREAGKHYHNDIYFGDSIATFYQKNIEYKFFNHYLKEKTKASAVIVSKNIKVSDRIFFC